MSNLFQCPPCRTFTPELIDCYNKIKAAGHDFEMIFVSSDRAENSFNEYYATMPWLSVPFGDLRKDSLASKFSVSGIRKLSLILEFAVTGTFKLLHHLNSCIRLWRLSALFSC